MVRIPSICHDLCQIIATNKSMGNKKTITFWNTFQLCINIVVHTLACWELHAIWSLLIQYTYIQKNENSVNFIYEKLQDDDEINSKNSMRLGTHLPTLAIKVGWECQQPAVKTCGIWMGNTEKCRRID